MNRYGRPQVAGQSRATASTLCQKCLKKDIHYSYECKSVAQERPYVSRPSRTQQLFNPKLVPKLTSDVPQDLLRKKGIADEQLAKAEQERGRKRERQSEDRDLGGAPKRMRSASVSSVSTISTNMSRSRSPPPTSKDAAQGSGNQRARTYSRTPPTRGSFHPESKPLSRSLSPEPHQKLTESEKKRRRDSVSSVDSYTSEEGTDARERTSSRRTRRRYQEHSPVGRGRRTESRSPHGGSSGRRRLSNDRPLGRTYGKESLTQAERTEPKPPPKERSLSPFSRRLALTQAMNEGR